MGVDKHDCFMKLFIYLFLQQSKTMKNTAQNILYK